VRMHPIHSCSNGCASAQHWRGDDFARAKHACCECTARETSAGGGNVPQCPGATPIAPPSGPSYELPSIGPVVAEGCTIVDLLGRTVAQPASARVNKEKRRAIFERLRGAMPAPTTELEYETPFQLLIAVILSAQATDVSVNKATGKLFEHAGSPQAIRDLGEQGLRPYIKSIGLYNTKACNIIKTCDMLLEKHDAKVPEDRKSLEALPGVGRKTANVILNTAFGQPTIAVDTHIYRVSNRTGLAPGKNVRQVEDKLERVVESEFKKDAHHWLILHGRYTCTARKPQCSQCIIRDLCEYRQKAPI